MKHSILPVEGIQERDIDLILLEEFLTDNSFCEWFVRETGLPEFTECLGARKVIKDFGLGQTDILFSYKSLSKVIFVLLENSLDDSVQNEKYDNYLNKTLKYVTKKQCDEAFCVLTAPKLYCEHQNYFEHFISYESIADRFEFIDTRRSLFKSELLKIASKKQKKMYKPVNSLPVQKFWNSYWEFKKEHSPGIKMKKPGIVPHNSDWPMLYDERLTGINFFHKLRKGNVDATFKNFPEEQEYKIKENLPDWAEFIKHNKTFSIRISTHKIDRLKDFEDQKLKVKKSLRKIEQLRNWIIENKMKLSDKIANV